MSKVEAISHNAEVPTKDIPKVVIPSEKTESFADALSKTKHGNLKATEKQLSIIGTICIAFAANVLIFGEKLRLDKLGKLSPIIAGATLLAGSLGILFCAESFGKKAQEKIAKLFESKDTPQKMTVKNTSVTPTPEKNTEDYKPLGLELSLN